MAETQEGGRQQLTAQQQIMISVLLNPGEAAARLRTTPGVLAVWRSTRRYPLKFIRVGRKIFYRESDIEHFLTLRTHAGIVEPQPGHRSRTARRRA